jgi:hypothetical protein
LPNAVLPSAAEAFSVFPNPPLPCPGAAGGRNQTAGKPAR